MKEKQMKSYLETRPLVRTDKQPMFDVYFKNCILTEKGFKQFQKVAYAIRLMSNGMNKSAFRAMFEGDELALNFAGACVKETKKKLTQQQKVGIIKE